jgi:hypothetical protein
VELVGKDDRYVELLELIEDDGLRGFFREDRDSLHLVRAGTLLETGMMGCRLLARVACLAIRYVFG